MKTKKILLYAFSFLAIIPFSCTSISSMNANSKNQDNIFKEKWKIVSVNNLPVSTSFNIIPSLEFDSSKKTFSFQSGCNALFGQYSAKANMISFGQIASTLKMCPDMKTENELKAGLPVIQSYVIKADTLTFFNKEKQPVIKLIKQNTETADLSGTWKMSSWNLSKTDLKTDFPNGLPTLIFNTEEGKIHGKGGCNNYFGTFKVVNNTLTFGPIGSTRMACPGNGENEYFKALQTSHQFELKGNKLILKTGSEEKITFIRN